MERAFLATETACAKPEGERELGMLREQQIVQSGWSAELRGAWAERKPAQEASRREKSLPPRDVHLPDSSLLQVEDEVHAAQ